LTSATGSTVVTVALATAQGNVQHLLSAQAISMVGM
jgi:hypothetical protein